MNTQEQIAIEIYTRVMADRLQAPLRWTVDPKELKVYREIALACLEAATVFRAASSEYQSGSPEQ